MIDGVGGTTTIGLVKNGAFFVCPHIDMGMSEGGAWRIEMLTEDQITEFKQLGFVTVPDLLTPEETIYFTRVFDETMKRLEESGYFDEEESSRTPRTKKGRQVAPLFALALRPG